MKEDYAHQHKLSLVINSVRAHLLTMGFFEHHLYSTQSYKIENTETFSLKEGLHLRFNPEPDIWQVGATHDKFFWIGSMYRNEKELSPLRRNEFTVVDVYQRDGSQAGVISAFVEILKSLERDLALPPLSGLEFKYATYEQFSGMDSRDFIGTYWMVVTDYPVRESFYDAKHADGPHTQKFEIFLIQDGQAVEIAACGKLDRNLNDYNYISNATEFVNQQVIGKEFFGFGIGLERLMYLYEHNAGAAR